MKILLLAPHPFYQERGTPIAVALLVRALAECGHRIDILTYHEGDDPPLPDGVRIHRIRKPPLAHGIKPGFSVKKLICDAFMLPHALRMARENGYDVVHAVEESVFMAMAIRWRRGIPYVYDMDSSLPQQVMEKVRALAVLGPAMEWMERQAIRGAACVVPMCDVLADLARRNEARKVVVLRDVPLASPATPGEVDRAGVPDLPAGGVRFMYVGNLETYQGIDLLLESFALLRRETENASLVIVGGTEADVARYRQRAAELGIGETTVFTGPQPIRLMGTLFERADVLVSPRVKGVNTPMKIYSYLQSGKPVLATNIPSHTQVLNPETAMLAMPRPEAIADAMQELARDPELRRRLGQAGKALVEREYSLEQFRKQVRELSDWLTAETANG